MKAEFHTRDISTNNLLMAYLKRMFSSGLDIFRNNVRSFRVTLSDTNGPKGGSDKKCTVQVHLYSGKSLFAAAESADAFEAISATVEKIKAQLRKHTGASSRRRVAKRELVAI